MEILKTLERLNSFKRLIELEIKEIGEIEFNKKDVEEKFINSNLIGVLSDMNYIIESLDYLNKTVAVEGNVNIAKGKIYIDNFKICGGDRIEVLINNEWEMIDIFKIHNEYHAEYLKEVLKDNKVVKGRIRLTQKELTNRR